MKHLSLSSTLLFCFFFLFFFRIKGENYWCINDIKTILNEEEKTNHTIYFIKLKSILTTMFTDCPMKIKNATPLASQTYLNRILSCEAILFRMFFERFSGAARSTV